MQRLFSHVATDQDQPKTAVHDSHGALRAPNKSEHVNVFKSSRLTFKLLQYLFPYDVNAAVRFTQETATRCICLGVLRILPDVIPGCLRLLTPAVKHLDAAMMMYIF